MDRFIEFKFRGNQIYFSYHFPKFVSRYMISALIAVAARPGLWGCSRSLPCIPGLNLAWGNWMYLFCVCCVGSELCDGPIPRPEES